MTEGQENAWEVTNDEHGNMQSASVTESEEQAKEEPVPEVEELPKAAESTVEEVAESYSPNLKYSVKDQEKEFPELLHSFVTDKEREDYVRDLLTKSDGIDEVKESRDYWSNQYTELNDTYTNLTNKLAELDYYLAPDSKNLHAFFKETGIQDQDLVDYVAGLLKEQDMSPQERQQQQQLRQQTVTSWKTQESQRLLQQQNEQLRRNNHEIAYERVMSLPEVRGFQQQLDSKLGVGSLRKLADQFGVNHYHQTGQDTTPELAIAEVMKQYKPLLGGTAEAQADSNDLVSATRELEEGRPTGVIPNVGKKTGTSPVKKRVRSIEDLKKLGREMQEA